MFKDEIHHWSGIVQAVRMVVDAWFVNDLKSAAQLLVMLLDDLRIFSRLNDVVRIPDDVDERDVGFG